MSSEIQAYNDSQTIEDKAICEKSIAIQWDYKNLVKRKGQLERLK